MEKTISEEALFRFSVVSQVLTLIDSGLPRAKAVDHVAALAHLTPEGMRREVSVRSIYRWLKDFEAGGTMSLESVGRPHVKTSAVFSKKFVDFITSERLDDDTASIPELIKRAERRGIIEDRRRICRQTVYRMFRRLDLPVCRRKKSRDHDMRRYAYPNRMLMLLCDGKHFRAGASRLRRLVYFYLDDATRKVLHAVCGSSEGSELFMRGFYELITKYGLPGAFYLDRGPGFIAKDCVRVAAALNIPFIFGEKRYPEGHGKIEKFNQTAKNALLYNLAKPEIDPATQALELRIQHYLEVEYNADPHSSLSGMTPHQRFDTDERALVFPESDKKLRQAFALPLSRKVTNDSVISIYGEFYEMPRGYARRWVTVYRHLLAGTVGLIHEGRMITLSPPDLEKNARLKRKRTDRERSEGAKSVKTAAELSFERDLGPIVGPDGGYKDKEEE